MPQLGLYHDDALYLLGARSLAEGKGYRIESLPGQPSQTKYPPLYPAWLALAWKLQPSFPKLMPLVAFLVWCCLPLYVWAAWRLFRSMGLPAGRCAWLAAAVALNPAVILFALVPMSELLFTALLIGAVLQAERSSRPDRRWFDAGLAGALGGLAFLARSAGLPLLLSASACYLFRKQFRQAACFAAGMLPFVAGWCFWAALQRVPGGDLVDLYYTDYLGFQLQVVPLSALPRQMMVNLDVFVAGAGQAFALFEETNFWTTQLLRLVLAGGVAGAIRMARATGRWHYPAFAVLYVLQLLIWYYPPGYRFTVPLYPLLLSGLYCELSHLAGMIGASFRRPRPSERIAGAGFVTAVAIAGLVLVSGHLGGIVFLRCTLAERERRLQHNRSAYEWIKTHTPPDAWMYSFGDPVLYLHTGRRALGLRQSPGIGNDVGTREMRSLLGPIPAQMRDHRLQYVVFTSSDFGPGPAEAAIAAFRIHLSNEASLRLVYSDPHAFVFRRAPL